MAQNTTMEQGGAAPPVTGSPLVVYLGNRLSSIIPNVPNGHFLRGVARRMPQHTRDVVSALYPEWQIVNENRMYVGPGIEDIGFSFSELAEELPEKPMILIMRDLGLGDVLLSLPAVKAIRSAIPHAHITYATAASYFPLFRDQGLVDALVPIPDVDLQNGPYDLVINWCRAFENYKIERNRGRRVESFFKHLCMDIPGDDAELVVAPKPSPEDVAFINGMLANNPGPYIVYVLKAAAWNRSYPVWRARDVLEAMHSTFPRHRIIVVDRQEDFGLFRDMEFVFPMCGKTTVGQVAALLGSVDLVVSPDTGLAHIAASMRTPTVVLASSQPYEWRFDHYGSHVRYMLNTAAAPCVPCWDWQRTPAKLKYCSKTKRNTCLESITPQEIASTSAMLLDSLKRRSTA